MGVNFFASVEATNVLNAFLDSVLWMEFVFCIIKKTECFIPDRAATINRRNRLHNLIDAKIDALFRHVIAMVAMVATCVVIRDWPDRAQTNLLVDERERQSRAADTFMFFRGFGRQ